MKTLVDREFLREAERFRLVFQCEACAHFAAESGACANEYPNAAHRTAKLEGVETLEFCKEFELY